MGDWELGHELLSCLTNGSTGRVDHTIAQLWSMAVSECQDGYDAHFPHIDVASNDPVSSATGLAPNQ